MPKSIVCADIGTSSLKAALITQDGTVRLRQRIPFFLYGTSRASAEWLDALKKAVALMAKEAELQHAECSPCGICISGNGPTLVLDDGTTLLWNEPCDAAAPPTRSLFIPRLCAMRRMFLQKWRAASHVLSGPEYLIFLLTGKAVTILPEARYRDAYWTPQELARCGFAPAEQDKLPPFVPPGALVGTTHAFASVLGKDLAVYAGAPDFVSALAGTNTLFPGALCDRAGSSEGLNLCTAAPLVARGIRTLPSPVAGLWNASVLLSDTGSRFSAFLRMAERVQGKDIAYADAVRDIIAAEQGTGQPPRAITDGDVLSQGVALVTQIAREVRDGVMALTAAAQGAGLAVPQSMAVTGGQAANRDWNALKSRTAGIPIDIPECTDAELLGDAAFAFTGMGMFSLVQEAATHLYRVQETLRP